MSSGFGWFLNCYDHHWSDHITEFLKCASSALKSAIFRSHTWVLEVSIPHQCPLLMTDHMSEFLKYASSACPPLLTPDWPGLPLEAPEIFSYELPPATSWKKKRQEISHLLCLLHWVSSPQTPLETSCEAAGTPTHWKPESQHLLEIHQIIYQRFNLIKGIFM